MNYYEKIIQDKNNALREYLEVPFYTYTGRKIQKLDDLNYFIKETERLIDSHKKRKDLEGKGKETLQKAEKNVMEAKEHIKKYGEYYTGSKINSKGETKMGYYADLIKERKNAKPFYTPGLSTKELKTRAEVERYMFEQRREVDKIINWMESTKKKIQEIEKEPKPHDIGWAERLRQAQSSYKQYKRWMEMHEDFAARAEDWLDKNRNSKVNSKEEKENASFNIVRKFYYKECLVSVTKLDSGKYSYIIEKDGREEGSDKSFSTQSSAETDAKKEVEAVWNSEEEKENESKSQIEKRIKDAEERVKLFQRLEKEVQAKLEEGDEDDESRLRRQRESYRDGIANNQSLIEYLKKELKTAKNEKEDKGHYAKLAEEKAAKNNSRSWRIEFLGDSYYIETLADCKRAWGKANQLLLTKQKALEDDIRWMKDSFAKFDRELQKIESEVARDGGK